MALHWWMHGKCNLPRYGFMHLSFQKRKGFLEMLDKIINKVSRAVATYKDRLSRIGF